MRHVLVSSGLISAMHSTGHHTEHSSPHRHYCASGDLDEDRRYTENESGNPQFPASGDKLASPQWYVQPQVTCFRHGSHHLPGIFYFW